MSGMGKPGTGTQQVWEYTSATDAWYAGNAASGSGGSGGPVAVTTASFFVAADPNTSLYWPFDESSGGTFANAGVFGVANLFAVNSAHVTAGQPGFLGNSVKFDGTSGQSWLTGSNTANIGSPGAAVTIHAWVKPTVFSGFNTICYKKYLNDASWGAPFVAYGMVFANSNNGQVTYSMTTGASLTQVTSNNDTAGRARINQWNHVALTYDGTTMIGYLNGVEVVRGSKTGNIDFGSSGNWMVGGDQGGDPFFGYIDELRVEPVTRPADYIAAVYATGYYRYYVSGSNPLISSVSGSGSTGSLQRLTNIDAATAIWWTMDDAAAPYANYGHGTAQTLTASFGTPTPHCQGLFSNSVGFNGSQGLATGPTTEGENTSALSVSMWVWMGAFGSSNELLHKRYQTASWTNPFVCWNISQSGAGGIWQVGVAFAGNRQFVNVGSFPFLLPLYTWTLLSFTYDTSSGTIKVYFNGALAGSSAIVGSPAIDYGQHGGYEVGATVNQSSQGSVCYIDDVRIEPGVVRSQAYYSQVFKQGLNLLDP